MRITIGPAVICVLVGVGCAGNGDDGGDDTVGQCTADNDVCTGDMICISGACEAAYGRIYDITNISVQVPTTDPNGDPWDVGGGAPDLYVQIAVGAAIVATTTTVEDQFSATFAGPYPVQPVGGGTLILQAFDEDIAVDDPAYECDVDPVTAATLRERLLLCESAGNSMSYEIEPR